MNDHTMLAALVAALSLAGAAGAHEFRLGDLTIGHPYAIETPATARSGAGYLTITNAGDAPDRLLAVEAAVPAVQIHGSETDAAGVTRMLPVDGLEIPPGGTVALEPGGLHVMFMGLGAPFEAGAKVDATLVFERAGEIAVQFNVEPRGAGADAVDHGAMHEGDD